MRVTVNIALNFSMGALTHNALAPPAIPAPVPMLSVEMIATQMWTLGYALGQNKLTTTVRHYYMPIVQDGHDCGTMIPDITPPVPPNTYYAIMWPFSSRKPTFAASTVKMNGQAVGCAQTLGLPPLPMMTCGDPISAPTALVHPIQALNTVTVGMTFGDFMMGLLAIAVSIVIDYVFEFGFSRSGAAAMRNAVTRTAREAASEATQTAAEAMSRIVMRELANKAFAGDLKNLGKRAVSALAGFGISALGGNPTLKAGLGGPFAGVDPTWTPSSGWSFGDAPSPAPGGSGGSHGEAMP